MDEEAARKAERVKALLAGYYGAGHAAPGPQAGPAGAPGQQHSKAQPAVASVDSAAFDANQHIAYMLKTSSLERLMVEHRNTAREIKNLDTDMQQLVTENYSKFITATDTIRTMKTEIDQAVPELQKLNTIMSEWAEEVMTSRTRSSLAHSVPQAPRPHKQPLATASVQPNARGVRSWD